MNKVRCRDCGFLAVRSHKTLALAEVDEIMRELWRPMVSPNDKVLEGMPALCAVQAFDLIAECGPDPRAQGTKVASLPVINKMRDCDKFTKWMPGFDPKEHKEMMREESLLRMQRRFQVMTTLIAGGFGLAGVIIGASITMLMSRSREPVPIQPVPIHIHYENKADVKKDSEPSK